MCVPNPTTSPHPDMYTVVDVRVQVFLIDMYTVVDVRVLVFLIDMYTVVDVRVLVFLISSCRCSLIKLYRPVHILSSKHVPTPGT
jgi:hypothetical protein